jgi:hypothetical protein
MKCPNCGAAMTSQGRVEKFCRDSVKDAWKNKLINVLGLPDRLIYKLFEARIDTLGELANLDYWNTADADDIWVISDAWEAFWKANPQYKQAKKGSTIA